MLTLNITWINGVPKKHYFDIKIPQIQRTCIPSSVYRNSSPPYIQTLKYNVYII